MSRTKGFKCYNIQCGSCIGKTLCGEPADAALVCADRIVDAPKLQKTAKDIQPGDKIAINGVTVTARTVATSNGVTYIHCDEIPIEDAIKMAGKTKAEGCQEKMHYQWIPSALEFDLQKED